MRLHRFRDGRGEALEVTAKGKVVTARVEPLGVYAPAGATRVEIAGSFAEVDAIVERIVAAHRADGFAALDDDALAAARRAIEPYATWERLSPATFAAHFAYLAPGRAAAALAELAARVQAVDVAAQRIDLAGGAVLTFALPRGADDLADPEPLRTCWAHHAYLWAERDGFELVLGRDVGPPEPDHELRDFAPGAVQWFMSRGSEQFWFLAGDGALRKLDLDGGVGDPIPYRPGRIWIDAVLGL